MSFAVRELETIELPDPFEDDDVVGEDAYMLGEDDDDDDNVS